MSQDRVTVPPLSYFLNFNSKVYFFWGYTHVTLHFLQGLKDLKYK